MWLVFNRSSSRGAARSRQFFVQTVLGKSVQSNRERETKQVHGFGSKSKCEVVGGLNSRGVVRTEVPGQWVDRCMGRASSECLGERKTNRKVIREDLMIAFFSEMSF